MLMRSWALPLLVAAGFLALALWADPASADKKATPAEIKGLIEKMGAGDFEEREKATQLLDAIGEPALEPLRLAQKSSDPEVRRRANDLVARIEKRTLGAAVLRPTRVHLVYKDTPLTEALVDLEKKTGYTVRLYDPKNALAGKKVTLDTGETTFWDALDQLCAKAGLVEASPANPAMRPVPPPPAVGPVPVPVAPAAPGVPIRRAVPSKPTPPKTRPAPKEEPEEKKEVKKPGKAKAVTAVAEAPAVAPAAPNPFAGPAAGGAAAPPVPAVGPAPAVPPGAAGPVPSVPAQILLIPGPAKKLPADTSTSVRVRASDQALFGRGGAGQSIVVLEMTPEPRLQWQQTVSVRLKQAVDDQGQKLSEAVPEPAPAAAGAVRVFRVRGGGRGVVVMGAAAGPMAAFIGGGLQYHPIHLKKGPKPAKSLKVLEGVITAKVLTKAEEVVTIDNLAKAVGKTVEGKRGATVKVVRLNEDRRGALQARIEVTLPEGMVPDQAGAFPGGFMPPGGGIGVPVPLPPPVPPPVRIRIRPAVKPRPPKTPPPPAKAGFAFAAEEKKPAEAPAEPPPPPLPAPPVAIPAPAIGVGGAPGPASWAAGPGSTSGITLRDEKGKELPARILLVGAAGGKMHYQVWHQPQKGLGKPAKLVFKARRAVEVDIPFELKDVPLP